MPDTPDPTAVVVAAAIEGGRLRITVTNRRATELKQMAFEVRLSTAWVDRRLGAAAKEANAAGELASPAGEAVTVAPTGWTARVLAGEGESLALRVEQLDPDTEEPLPTGALGAGASVTVTLGIVAGTGHVETMPYSWSSGAGSPKPVHGEVTAKTPDVVVEPEVRFGTNQLAPLMVRPGTLVELSWTIERANSATVQGPLPGGNSELTLSTDATDTEAPYPAARGTIRVLAVGPASYVLTADVLGAGGARIRVTRTVTIDVAVPERYGFIRPRRTYVLPRTMLQVDWAAWGVRPQITLRAGNRGYERLELTDRDLSGTYRGDATWRLWEPGDPGQFTVSMQYSQEGTDSVAGPTVTVQSWRQLGTAGGGVPLALAHSGSTVGLLTDQGLWVAGEGGSDTLGAWSRAADATAGSSGGSALAAVGGGFAVLRRESYGTLRLLRVDEQGRTSERRLAIDLPSALGSLASRSGARLRMVTLRGTRLLVVVDADGQRRSFAVTLSDDSVHDAVDPERLVDAFPGHDLVVAANGLYAVDRAQARMFRFEIAEDGTLSAPQRATGPSQEGTPFLADGPLVTIDDVLVVALGARGRQVIPPPEQQDGATVRSVGDDRPDQSVTEDMVYNPQTDTWSVCGHGLTIPAGSVATARSGTRPRAWVVTPDRTVHTLTGADRDLFATDYRQGNSNWPLASATPHSATVTLVNRSRYNRAALDKSDELGSVAARGLVVVEPLSCTLRPGEKQTFTVHYDRASTSEVVLRFGTDTVFIQEVVLSGTGLTTVTSRLRRRTSDGGMQDVPYSETRHTGTEIPLTDTSGFTPGATLPLPGLVATGAGVLGPTGNYVYVPFADKDDPGRRRVVRFGTAGPRDVREVRFTGGDVAAKPNTVLAGYQKVSVAVDPTKPPLVLDFSAETATSERSYDDGTFYEIARAGAGAPETRSTPDGDTTVLLTVDDAQVTHDWVMVWTTSGSADQPQKEVSRVRLGRREWRGWDAPGQDRPGSFPRTAALWKWGSSARFAVSPDGSAVGLSEIGHVAVQEPGWPAVDQWVSYGDPGQDPGARQYTSGMVPGPVVFSPDGKWLYSGHAQHVWNQSWPLEPDSRPGGSCTGARDVGGRTIRVGRMSVGGVTASASQLTLPDADDWWITGIDRRDRQSWNAARKEVAFSLMPSPDGRSLFVTIGRKIRRIDIGTFTLATWEQSAELPCRLVHVGRGTIDGTWAVTVLYGRYESNDTGIVSGTFGLHTVAAPGGGSG